MTVPSSLETPVHHLPSLEHFSTCAELELSPNTASQHRRAETGIPLVLSSSHCCAVGPVCPVDLLAPRNVAA